MQESSTYQHIVEEGRQIGLQEGHILHARRIVLRVGRQQLGRPRKAVKATVSTLTDLERLDRMIDRIFQAQAADWNDLLSTP